ncbi:MAG: hypothetical protein DCC55_27960 [Chloroflexi bacterium]|nr:MAG: hypothetical protein DCC55_27960 [Chloroflexota bacterium]
MRNRVIVHLLPSERAALLQMAEHDFRPPNEQIRLLIISEAQRRGILPTNDNTNASSRQAQSVGVAETAR